MKRLLLPLLAALALPNAVNAGNLGVADLILTGVDAKKLEKPRNSFVINVGKHNREGIAEFSNGRFMIKTDERRINLLKKSGHLPVDIELDESGITPDQVISYNYYIDDAVIFTLFYLDSEGKKQLASWGFGVGIKEHQNNAKNFNDAFLNWLNQK